MKTCNAGVSSNLPELKAERRSFPWRKIVLSGAVIVSIGCGGGASGNDSDMTSVDTSAGGTPPSAGEREACQILDATNIAINNPQSEVGFSTSECPADVGTLFVVSNRGEISCDFEVIPSDPMSVAIEQPRDSLQPGESKEVRGFVLCNANVNGPVEFLVQTLEYQLDSGQPATRDELIEICGANASVGNTMEAVTVNVIPFVVQ